jgi:catechol 2,3-dioxygenase-like lactoylglutathione lyase family enzyme
MNDIRFSGGPNIAIKIPKAKYETTVSFYRNVLGMDVEERPITHPTISRTHRMKFGSNVLWLDCVDNYSRSETWLELNVGNIPKATAFLQNQGISPCDELEEIPENMHWITDPAGNVFLLTSNEESS